MARETSFLMWMVDVWFYARSDQASAHFGGDPINKYGLPLRDDHRPLIAGRYRHVEVIAGAYAVELERGSLFLHDL